MLWEGQSAHTQKMQEVRNFLKYKINSLNQLVFAYFGSFLVDATLYIPHKYEYGYF